MSVKSKFGEGTVIHWKDRKRWCGLPLSFTRYFLVEKPGEWFRLYCEKGLLTSHVEEIQLYRVDDFTVKQTLTNKIFGVGTIMIKSDDKTIPKFEILRVKTPYQVYDKITECVAKDRRSKGMRWGEFSN